MGVKLIKQLGQCLRMMFKYTAGLLVILIIVPVLILVLTPFIVYRRILFYSAKYFKTNLGKMLNTRGTMFGFENVYKYPRYKIVTALILEGCPGVEDIYTGFKSAMEMTVPHTGDLLYPELTQNLEKWMDYLFWKPVVNFSIKDHVEYIDNHDKSVTFQDAERVIKEESLVAFDKNKALWKLKVFTNYTPNKTDHYVKPGVQYSLLVFCSHHALVDGFSVVKFTHKVGQATYTEPNGSKEPFQNKSMFGNILKGVGFLFAVPRDTGEFMFNSNLLNKRWTLNDKTCELEVNDKIESQLITKSMDSYRMAHSEMIPFERIKELRSTHKVSSLAVIIAGITGSIRKTMFLGSSKIPGNVRLLLPFPMANHPDKLRNYVSGVSLMLPVGEKDPLKRLLRINKAILKVKKSTVPIIVGLLLELLGSFPPSVIKRIFKAIYKLDIGFLTSFPCPREEIKLFGNCIWKDTLWTYSMMTESNLLTFAFTTYAEHARFVVAADPSVVPTDSNAAEIIGGFLNELNVLECSTTDLEVV